MKNSAFRHNLAFVFLLLAPSLFFAQEKYVETFNVSEDVTVSVNTTHTNVIFETWNKDKVQVEAYIDGEDLSEEEKQTLFDDWNFTVMGNSKKVTVVSKGGGGWNRIDFHFNFETPPMPPMPPMSFFETVPIPPMPPMPPFPDGFLNDLGNMQFDYEAFQKDKEGYIKEWETRIKKSFGEDFEKEMEEWGEKAEKSRKGNDSLHEKYKSKMKVWENEHGKKMELWGEAYGKKMEKWAEEMEKRFDKEGGNFTKKEINTPHGKSTIIQGYLNMGPKNRAEGQKTIIIRMPEGANAEINVRYGEIKMADAYNLNATLKYAPFNAKSVAGEQTRIKAAYAPVTVSRWEEGILYVDFVDRCDIAYVGSINMQANSSDVQIGSVEKEAFLSGSFGNLKIKNISDSFKTIDVVLKNTDAVIELPSTSFSFYFNGQKSHLKYPMSLQATESSNYDRRIVKGFSNSNNTHKTVTINASYSDVVLE